MSAQDPSSAQPAATAATRLDTAPTTIDSNPTRLDRSGASMAETPTVLDTEHKAAVNTTVGLIQLPSEIRNRYRVQSRLPTAGAEADLFVVQATDGIDAELHVLKLYRFGIQPKADVLEKVRAGNPEHLIRIHEFGQSDGHWYEIMEYVAHGSFRQLLRGRALPQQSLLEVIRELAIGLEHLHGFGLIHRDLKPENILARETFPLDLVITDFGISSVTEMSQRFTSASRTVRYAAPEALSGVISTAVDYWSLGMIVAEAATGHHPFAQLSDERAVMQWLTTRPIDISELQDSRIQNLCRGLLQRDPAKRWGAEHLSRWLQGDATLLAPEERPIDAQVSASNEQRAKTAYKIEEEECWTPSELGVALARHWMTARRDLGRGLVRKWCEREFNDVATERFFLDLEEEYDRSAEDDEEEQKSLDHQLLDVILHLCPDIPPVFLGRNLASKADIAAVLDEARSVAESDEAEDSRTIIRELVGTEVAAPLLSRFKLQPDHELIPVQKALQELDDLEEISFEDSTCPEVFAPWQIYGIPEDFEWDLDYEATVTLKVALALDPSLAKQIHMEAVQFAEGTEFKFWFHKCLAEDLFPQHWIENAIALQETLNRAKAWYARVLDLIGEGYLNEEPLKTPWTSLLSNVSSEEDMDKALQIAEAIQNADLDPIALSLASIARLTRLPYDTEDWKSETLQQISAALHAHNQGSSTELETWCEAARLFNEIASAINAATDGLQDLSQICGEKDSIYISKLLQRAFSKDRTAATVYGLRYIAETELPPALEYTRLLNDASVVYGASIDALHRIIQNSVVAANELTATIQGWKAICTYAKDLSAYVEVDSDPVSQWQQSAKRSIAVALESAISNAEQWNQWKNALSEMSATIKETWFLERSKAFFAFMKAGKRCSPVVWGILSEAVKKALPQDAAKPLFEFEKLTNFLIDAVKLSHSSVVTPVKNPKSLDRVISGIDSENRLWRRVNPTELVPDGRDRTVSCIERFASDDHTEQPEISLKGGQLYRRKFAPFKGPFCLNPRQFTASPESYELQPLQKRGSIQLASTVDDMYAVYEGTEDSNVTVTLSKQVPDNFWHPIALNQIVDLEGGERYRLHLRIAIPLENFYKLRNDTGLLTPRLTTNEETNQRSTLFDKWADDNKIKESEEASKKAQEIAQNAKNKESARRAERLGRAIRGTVDYLPWPLFIGLLLWLNWYLLPVKPGGFTDSAPVLTAVLSPIGLVSQWFVLLALKVEAPKNVIYGWFFNFISSYLIALMSAFATIDHYPIFGWTCVGILGSNWLAAYQFKANHNIKDL